MDVFLENEAIISDKHNLQQVLARGNVGGSKKRAFHTPFNRTICACTPLNPWGTDFTFCQ